MPSYDIDYSKWKRIAEQEAAEEEDEIFRSQNETVKLPKVTMEDIYAKETGRREQMDRLQQLKIKMAVDAYEKRRPADTVMHHYWVKEAGDPEAIGEYFPTGDERNGAPIYRNQHGLVLSREAQSAGDGSEETYSWVIGSLPDRRPLYGVKSDDLSVPTLGWQAFTAPEPAPVIRYYTQAVAARTFKERGNRAFGRRDWKDAESWYSQALKCSMDPEEYAEPYSMLLSNRSETRMKLQDFRGAADDADDALKYLKSLLPIPGGIEGEPTRVLRQKTVLRLARALQAMNRMSEAMRLLHHERRNYPHCQEMQRLAESTRLALRSVGRGTPSQSRGEREEDTQGMDSAHGKKLMAFVAQLSEDLQKQVETLKARDGDGNFAFPIQLMTLLNKLEYVLIRAHTVEGECLETLQALLKTNGVLRCLVQIIQAQWKTNLDGKFVDLFKLPGASAVASVIALLCIDNEPSLRYAAGEAHCFLALLGGCNCKVDQDTCERMVSLVAGLWEHCRQQFLELVQLNSVVVERAAFYLSQAVLASSGDDPVSGPDSPVLSAASQEQAALLLLDMVAQGGRVKKRALRGMMPQLAGYSGTGGFFSSKQAAVRTLGELVARNAIEDPQLVSAEEVTQMLRAVQHLIDVGPAASVPEENKSTVEVLGGGKAMTFVDLQGWIRSAGSSRYAALLLEVVSKTMDYKLLKDRELEREAYEAAFNSGNGLRIVVPLLQAPPELAEHALLCLATMAQTYLENVESILSLSTLQALLGLPSPASKPIASYIDRTLKEVPVARQHAAKLLMQCTASQAFMDVIQQFSEPCIKELVKLGVRLWNDGAGSVESFMDIMHTFHAISLHRPDALSCHLREADMLHLLLRLEKINNPATSLASEILKTLRKDRNFKRAFAPVKRQFEEGYDPELELKLRQQESSLPMSSRVK